MAVPSGARHNERSPEYGVSIHSYRPIDANSSNNIDSQLSNQRASLARSQPDSSRALRRYNFRQYRFFR